MYYILNYSIRMKFKPIGVLKLFCVTKIRTQNLNFWDLQQIKPNFQTLDMI